ncbi:putative IBR domain, E3 ubiquitin ligase RBR family, TRIAD supradomain-containing protein [Helianthus anomalus]
MPCTLNLSSLYPATVPSQLPWIHSTCVERVYCPNRECSELILNECGARKLKRCVCPDCKKPFCFRCRVPWHAGSTCRETRDENDVAFDVICEKNKWQRCPSCRRRVEHVDGCNHVICRFVLFPSLRYVTHNHSSNLNHNNNQKEQNHSL